MATVRVAAQMPVEVVAAASLTRMRMGLVVVFQPLLPKKRRESAMLHPLTPPESSAVAFVLLKEIPLPVVLITT